MKGPLIFLAALAATTGTHAFSPCLASVAKGVIGGAAKAAASKVAEKAADKIFDKNMVLVGNMTGLNGTILAIADAGITNDTILALADTDDTTTDAVAAAAAAIAPREPTTIDPPARLGPILTPQSSRPGGSPHEFVIRRPFTTVTVSKGAAAGGAAGAEMAGYWNAAEASRVAELAGQPQPNTTPAAVAARMSAVSADREAWFSRLDGLAAEWSALQTQATPTPPTPTTTSSLKRVGRAKVTEVPVVVN